jgi:hypothetical protein
MTTGLAEAPRGGWGPDASAQTETPESVASRPVICSVHGTAGGRHGPTRPRPAHPDTASPCPNAGITSAPLPNRANAAAATEAARVDATNPLPGTISRLLCADLLPGRG